MAVGGTEGQRWPFPSIVGFGRPGGWAPRAPLTIGDSLAVISWFFLPLTRVTPENGVRGEGFYSPTARGPAKFPYSHLGNQISPGALCVCGRPTGRIRAPRGVGAAECGPPPPAGARGPVTRDPSGGGDRPPPAVRPSVRCRAATRLTCGLLPPPGIGMVVVLVCGGGGVGR